MKKIFLSLLLLCSNAWAVTFTDLKFGQAQIADSQWNVSACTQTTTCQIYSKNPGTAYKIPWYNGQLSWAAGDYVAFAATGDSTNPWNAVQYNSSGAQKAVMGTGHIINMGTDYFFFVGNDNNTGQLFSTTTGFNSTAGVTWTGTLNPTVSQVNSYAATGSTTPLAPGQTATPAGPPAPAPTAIYMNNATVKITRAIPTTANSPGGEGPNNAFDNNPNTKYLNFDKKNAGVTIQHQQLWMWLTPRPMPITLCCFQQPRQVTAVGKTATACRLQNLPITMMPIAQQQAQQPIPPLLILSQRRPTLSAVEGPLLRLTLML